MMNFTTIPPPPSVKGQQKVPVSTGKDYTSLIEYWSGAWNKSYIQALMSNKENIRAVQNLVATTSMSEKEAWNELFESLLRQVVPD
jgi:hypothetical protein